MEHFLMVFYIIFFATGFMGGAALFLLSLRLRSRLLRPLLAFQLIFLLAIGLIVVYFLFLSFPQGLRPGFELFLLSFITALNAVVWGIAIIILRRSSPAVTRGWGPTATAEIFMWLVIAKTLANIVLMVTSFWGIGELTSPVAVEAWHLGSHILTGLAMAAFGITIRRTQNPKEPPVVRSLMQWYGIVALIFAPIGLVERAVELAGIPWLSYISLDHFFFFSWNIVSMKAAVRLFKPSAAGSGGESVMDAVPEERIQALGLSAREAEMAVMIARGLANKEIAAELNISPATVRTHIYNLYQKANAGSRVELLNKLRS
ncbi:MAG: helix-turn-helix domain-containing protein [Spirochaetota bacterium]